MLLLGDHELLVLSCAIQHVYSLVPQRRRRLLLLYSYSQLSAFRARPFFWSPAMRGLAGLLVARPSDINKSGCIFGPYL